jgi:hypothetical protein
MPAAISGGKSTVSFVQVKPRISIAVVDPSVAASYVFAAASSSYIELVVSSALDNTGLFKFIGEAAVVVDGLAKSYAKPLTESQSIAEALLIDFQKPLVDTISLLDSVSTLLTFIRSFADDASVTDQQSFDLSKTLTNLVYAFEAKAYVIDKQVSDGFAMNDAFDTGDGLVYSFASTTSNLVFLSDSDVFALQKARSESVSLSETGLISVQDYIDLSYVLEDYVGQSYTF